MARFQRILEGEYFVTGSLIPPAAYIIRKAYVAVYHSDHTDEAVKRLTATLLADFDQRFHPADKYGKAMYTGHLDGGYRNCYTGCIHTSLWLHFWILGCVVCYTAIRTILTILC